MKIITPLQEEQDILRDLRKKMTEAEKQALKTMDATNIATYERAKENFLERFNQTKDGANNDGVEKPQEAKPQRKENRFSY